MERFPPYPALEVVVPTTEFEASLASLQALGFAIDEIGPADAPSYARLRSWGATFVLQRTTAQGSEAALQPFLRNAEGQADIPGLATPVSSAVDPIRLEQELVINRPSAGEPPVGRAGMRYRDLLPKRHGGTFIASQIHVPEGGPVADYVHFHRIDFQLIYCQRGWVSVVYEDQGEPIVLEPGDAFLQPPGLRHQVLESSDDLWVIEVASPASHPTYPDHQLALPNEQVPTSAPDRSYGGQPFVHHQASGSPWNEAEHGVRSQNLGVAAATAGLLDVATLEFTDNATRVLTNDDDLDLTVVLEGNPFCMLVPSKSNSSRIRRSQFPAVPRLRWPVRKELGSLSSIPTWPAASLDNTARPDGF